MRERNLVPEKYRAFYVRWVWRFLQSEFNARELAERDKGQPMNFRIRFFSSVQTFFVSSQKHMARLAKKGRSQTSF